MLPRCLGQRYQMYRNVMNQQSRPVCPTTRHQDSTKMSQYECCFMLLHVASCCFILLPAEHREMYGDVWRCIECITAETWMPVSPAAQSKGEELTVKSPLVSLCPTLLALATKKPRDSMDMFNIQPNSTEINKYLDQKSWEVWPWHSPSRFYVAEQVTWIHTTIQYTKSSLRTPNLRCHHSFDIVCIQGSNNLSKPKKIRLAALFQSPSSLYHP